MEISPSWLALWKSAPVPNHGASSTKIIYLWTGGLGAIAAMILTLGFCVHSFWFAKADLVFAGVVGAMWTAVFGFASRAQNVKAKAEADVKKSGQDQQKEQ